MTQERVEKVAENIAQKLYDYAKQGREPEYNRYDEGYLAAIDIQGSFLVKEGIEWALNNQWISVDDKLPEEKGVYLVLVNGKVPQIIPFSNKWEIGGKYNITHWMEIPPLNN